MQNADQNKNGKNLLNESFTMEEKSTKTSFGTEEISEKGEMVKGEMVHNKQMPTGWLRIEDFNSEKEMWDTDKMLWEEFGKHMRKAARFNIPDHSVGAEKLMKGGSIRKGGPIENISKRVIRNRRRRSKIARQKLQQFNNRMEVA